MYYNKAEYIETVSITNYSRNSSEMIGQYVESGRIQKSIILSRNVE